MRPPARHHKRGSSTEQQQEETKLSSHDSIVEEVREIKVVEVDVVEEVKQEV
jgi:hypothetical protein